MRRKFKALATVAAITALTVALASTAAYADNVRSEVVAGGSTSFAAGGSTQIEYYIQDTSGACNASDGTPPSVTINAPAGLTASPTSLTFTACGAPSNTANRQTVVFSGSTAGSYNVTVSVSDSGDSDYNTSPAAITLTVTGSNTAPTIAVTGVSHGGSYEYGSVPAAGCQVNDAQDGASTPAASLTAITGTLSTYGLGSQTANCTYTDQGGLTANASATYSIVDTTKPAITIPSDMSREITAPTGNVVNYTASATDNVALNAAGLACTPASGSTFTLGTTQVSCSATDVAGNTDTKTFNVTIVDTGKPVLTLPGNITQEAGGPLGNVVTFSATATDAGDAAPVVDCVPPSGSTFAITLTSVNCTATDLSKNVESGSFSVTIQDTTAPSLSLPSSATVEATSASGRSVTFTPSASDIVDGSVAVVCEVAGNPISWPYTFPLGATLVSCSATDAHANTANGSFTITVVDTTAPVLTVPSGMTVEATGPSGATVNYTGLSATDEVTASPTITCSPASGSLFALGSTQVSCTATDAASNTSAAKTFNVSVVDTTAPALTVPSGLTAVATGATGAAVTFTGVSATDAVTASPTITCSPASGSVFAIGNTQVSCTATDGANNTSAAKTFTVSVNYRWDGFLQPINDTAHTGLFESKFKAGSTIPVKFQLKAADGSILSQSGAPTFQRSTNRGVCDSATASESIPDATATGGTDYRWDATAQQYIFNFSTKGLTSGEYRIWANVGDGSHQYVDICLTK
jgi:hypothetical protein